MNRTSAVIALVLTLASGCAAGATTRRSYRDVTAGAVAGAPPPTSAAISVGPGFRRTFDGRAGGPIEAMNWDSSCRGWIPEAPQIQFDLPGPASLVISGTSEVDTTMVVVLPDGRMLCNDDTNGLNPEVRAELPVGHYRVYIGTYSQGDSGSFHVEVGPPA